MQIQLAKRLYSLCCAVYPGPDALGLGTGWCTIGAKVLHNKHVDQFGRDWDARTPSGELGFVARRADVTINGVRP